MKLGPDSSDETERREMPSPAGPRELVTFFLIAYGFSWLCFLPLVLRGDGPYQFIMAGSFGPTIAAFACHRIYVGNFRAFRVIGSPSRTVRSAAIGIALVTFAYVVLPAFLVTGTATLNWTALVSPRMYNYSTFLGGPLGEEPGWRGYALARMQMRWGPLPSAILLGVLWTGWHLPLFFVNGWITSPLWLYMLFVVGLAVIISFVTNVAEFAIVPAILMHAVFNTVPKFLNAVLAGVHPSMEVRFDLVLATCGLVVAVCLAILTKGQLGAQSRH